MAAPQKPFGLAGPRDRAQRDFSGLYPAMSLKNRVVIYHVRSLKSPFFGIKIPMVFFHFAIK